MIRREAVALMVPALSRLCPLRRLHAPGQCANHVWEPEAKNRGRVRLRRVGERYYLSDPNRAEAVA